MQTLFINTKLFDEKAIDSSMNPIFVRLDEDLTEVREASLPVSMVIIVPKSASPPDEVKDVLLGMRAAMASQGALSFFLPDNLTQIMLVPLAAVLIDYPVAYMPVSPSQTAFLGAEPLDVYEVAFSLDIVDSPSTNTRDFTFLKFSCPRKLADTCPRLSHTHLVQRLEDIFTPRLDKIGAGIAVRHHTETLDRVAL